MKTKGLFSHSCHLKLMELKAYGIKKIAITFVKF